jgi:hypothetical protein
MPNDLPSPPHSAVKALAQDRKCRATRLYTAIVYLTLAWACGQQKMKEPSEPESEITIGPDADTSGNYFGRGVSKQFGRPQLQKLHDFLNSEDGRREITALNCGKTLPQHEYSVTLWPDDAVTERQVRLQMTPRLYKGDGCLEESLNYVFQRAVKTIDPGPPIDYGYKDPKTGEHLDTSRFAEELPEKPECVCPPAN